MILTLIIFTIVYILSHTLWKKWIDKSFLFSEQNMLFTFFVTFGIMFVINTTLYFIRYDEKRLYDEVEIIRYNEKDSISISKNWLNTELENYSLEFKNIKYVQTDTIDGLAADIITLKAKNFNQLFILDGSLDKLDSIIIYNAPRQSD